MMASWVKKAVSWLSIAWTLTTCSSLQSQSRAKFLSSSAAAFLASTAVVGVNPDECYAKMNDFSQNPRYLDQELEMKYAEGPGKKKQTCIL